MRNKANGWTRWLIVLGVVLAAFVAVLAFAAWRVERRLMESKDALIADLEAQLGRPVRIGFVDVDLFPRPTLEVRDVLIGPDPRRPAEADRAPLVLERGRLRVGTFATLVSLGRRPVIAELVLEGPVVNVVRFADGSTNWQDIATRLEGPPDDREPDPRLRALRIADGRVDDGTVRLIDARGQDAPAEIRELDLLVEDASLRGPFSGRLSAAVFAQKKNLDVTAHFGRARAVEGDEPPSSPPLRTLDVRSDRIELAPLAPFLAPLSGEMGLALERAAILADLRLELGALARGGAGPASAVGFLDLREARFAGGRPFDGRVELDLTADPDPWDLDIRTLHLSVGEMWIESSGRLLGLTRAPRFDDFRVRSHQLDFDVLRAYYPRLDDALGVVLSGPFSLQADAAEGQRQQFSARLDLTQAGVRIPRTLDKARGVPLVVSVEGEVEDDTVALHRAALEIAQWRLVARGTVESLRDDAPALNLSATTESSDTRGLLQLLPEVEDARRGELALEAELRGTTEDPAGEVRLTIANLDVGAPQAQFRGGGTALLHVRPRPGGRDLRLDADFTALEARLRDLVNKPRATQLRVHATAEQREDRLDSVFELHVGELSGQGRLSVRGPANERAFDFDMQASPFALASVLTLLPRVGATTVPPDLRVGGEIDARGVMGRPETLHLQVSSFKATAGESDVSGSLTLENLRDPLVQADLRSSNLDVDDFLPRRHQPAERDRPKGRAEPGALDRTDGQIVVTVAAGRAKIVTYRDLRAELDLTDGRVHARTLTVSAYGGRFSGAGSTFAPFDRDRPFHAVGEIEGLELEPMLAEVAGLPDLMQGVVSAEVDLSGRSLDREAIQQSLRGTVSGAIDGAVFEPLNLVSDIRGALARGVEIPGLADLLRAPSESLPDQQPLGDVKARLQFVDGAIELDEPLRADTPYGPLALRGRIGLDQSLDLGGTLSLTPEAASLLVGDALEFEKSLPITLRIGGAARSPAVSIANFADTARVLVRTYLESELGRRLPGPAGDLPGSAEDLREQIEEEGRRRARDLGDQLELPWP